MKVEYTGNQFEDTIPFFNSVDITDSITLPYCYVIPREWSIVAERMRMHGVNIVESTQDQRALATRYKFRDVKFASSPYEGRQSVTCNYDTFEDSVTIAAGSYIVYPDQRALRLIVHSLEPKSPDSFLRWGFMNAIFEQKEYFEEYVMEKVALEMIQNNPQLKQEFEDRLTGDPEFAKSPRRRLQFFYERSPYIDSRQNLYPIFRIEKSIKLL
jgi:hypothetical protein